MPKQSFDGARLACLPLNPATTPWQCDVPKENYACPQDTHRMCTWDYDAVEPAECQAPDPAHFWVQEPCRHHDMLGSCIQDGYCCLSSNGKTWCIGGDLQ